MSIFQVLFGILFEYCFEKFLIYCHVYRSPLLPLHVHIFQILFAVLFVGAFFGLAKVDTILAVGNGTALVVGRSLTVASCR